MKLPRAVIALNLGWIALFGVATGCSSSLSSSGSSTSSRTLTAFDTTTGNTVVTTDAFNTTQRECTQVTLDTSSCESAREALGLSGNWLKFSCNVAEGLATSSLASTTTYSDATYVTLTSEDYPDYTSSYWATSGSYDFSANSYTVTGLFDSLYSAYTTAFPDPGSIASQGLEMYIPLNPTAASSKSETMPMGEVGMTINGVSIYDSVAGDTDNIFAEDGSFDQCGGHPDQSDSYHYHGDPYALSYQDDNLIGVMRDGFFIYGANDSSTATGYTNGSALTAPGSQNNIAAYGDNNSDSLGTGTSSDLYIYGGHTGVPPTGGSSIFHYHLTEWKGCYSEPQAGTKNASDGETDDSYNASPTCSGTSYDVAVTGHSISAQWVDAWFLTGHGNGGVYDTLPSGLTGQSPSQSTTAIRYYYGTPGSCTGCHNGS